MKVQQVQVEDMMEAREKRACKQRELLERYRETLICFSMNIAGPIKNSDLIQESFSDGLEHIFSHLKMCGISVLFHDENYEFTGNEAFIVVSGQEKEIKEMMVDIEENHPLGRLFDIDVLNSNGKKIDRQEVGRKVRKCLLCGKEVSQCASRRFHSVEELPKMTINMMQKYFFSKFTEEIAGIAVKALMYEVTVSPKPGLVDRFHNGAHVDMDFYTFLNSIVALIPHFTTMVNFGFLSSKESPKQTFRRLRYEGIHAEVDMYRVTGQVNVHKGAIFSIGILCGAVGRLKGNDKKLTIDNILKECVAMTKEFLDNFFKEIEKKPMTAGGRFYREYGIKGIRGEVASGFPTVQKIGLPVLKEMLQQGYTNDVAGAVTLLYLLMEAADTNVIARSNYDTYMRIKHKLNILLSKNQYPNIDLIKELDADFVRKNISPGGSADLLAVCWFLYFIEKWAKNHEW